MSYFSNQIVSAGSDNTIQLWSLDGKHQRSLDNHMQAVTDLAIVTAPAPELSRVRLISSSEDRTLRLWQPEIGRMVKFMRLLTIPRRIAWYRDDLVFVGCDEGLVCLINFEEMKIIREYQTDIRPIYELAVSHENVLVGGVGGIISLRH